ncbi:flagellar hook-basal body complex protein [Motiliproteus sediminis]|uniref:flagellar hook-basal body complex protein n=1 Tax=Motiliproteus sediminis TaxID=1468178 RepID=UPI001AEFC758|nr:flagellar hook-basal body complex protein [Motiliproteus sediminis]
MAFNTAITGLKASTIELDVTGNNIANASTVGFKSGRTEFADIFTTVVVGAGSTNNPGAGVIVSDIAQDFTAGTIEFTNNNLDLAIDGSGFFQLNDGQGGTTYTRAGGFELDKDGNVVSKNGKFLQGYGLDDAGNQLPIGTMAVSQKESPPQATESIGLSFNVDSRADADGLLRPYDPDDSASYTFSTTTRTFDSLGNENTIKFDYVEQPALRERQTLNFADLGGFPIPDGTVVQIAGGDVTLNFGGPITDAADLVAGILGDANALNSIRTSDGRVRSIAADAAGTGLEVTYFASAANVEDVVTNFPAGVNVTGTSADVSAAEVQGLLFDGTAFPAAADGSITIGSGTKSYQLDYAQNATVTDIITQFENNQSAILAIFPEIDTISGDPTNNNQLLITYKTDQGDLDPLAVSETGAVLDTVAMPGGQLATIENGDNSFQGVYQMYAYLNGTDLLDIGKALPPGASGNPTEPGPVVITFDNTTGTLQSVNGSPVSASGLAPRLTIQNADPANPQTDVILDLSGTTQFASESIVKSSTQDGFTKGDLIGVTFAADGTMVASFSNGQNSNLGIVALATFENQGGLQPTGNTEWSATLESGQAILNPPGTGLNGSLRSAALEQSNVDLSEELVALIEAQRNFQANSKTLQTENAVTQAILQIS